MIRAVVRGDAAIHQELARIMAELATVLADPEPIQAIIADTVLAQMDQELDPEGTAWAPLSPEYQVRKAQIAPGAPMGDLLGKMKEPANLRGFAITTGETLIVTYGVDPEAIAHAVSFTEGGPGQPPRPFYGLNAQSEQALQRYFSSLVTL